MKYTCGPVTGPAARKTRASSCRPPSGHDERLADRLEVGVLVAHGAVERQDRR